MGRSRIWMDPKNIRRSIKLSCGHPEGPATLHQSGYEGDPGPFTAWCPVCEADVEFTRTRESEDVS